MKTALCFAGTGRSIEYTFENIKSKLIDPIDNCDIYVYIADNPKAELTKELFSDLTSNIDVVQEEDTDPTQYRFRDMWPPSIPSDLNKGRDIYLKMIRSRKHLLDMIDDSYDRVIFSRMDVLYQTDISEVIEKLDMSHLWIPNFHNWLGGYNDRFAISNYENLKSYLCQWDYMDQYKSENFPFQAETALKRHLDEMGVNPKFFKYNFIRVRGDGRKHDSTFAAVENVESRPCSI